MQMIKRLFSVILFLAFVATGVVLSASGNSSAAHNQHSEKGRGATLAEQAGDAACPVADAGLRFLSDAWRESHKKIIAGETPDGCDQGDCYACHISAAPHSFTSHVSEYAKDKKSCLKCHDYDSCNDCHQAKWAHAEDNSFADHGKFLNGRMASSCKQCHTVEWCNECHKDNKTAVIEDHGQNFVTMHPMFLAKKPNKEKIDKCMTCHGQKFCVSCHAGKDVHPFKWHVTHADRMAELDAGATPTENDRCLDCHKSGFCSRCHESSGLMHSTHEPDWVKSHADDPMSKTGACVACHSPDYCSRCHEISLPHDKEFVADHKIAAELNPDTCSACHKSDFCMSCHFSKKPADHAQDWHLKHGESAKKNTKYCNTCHDKKFCGWCHETSTMKVTHVQGWDKKHSATTSLSELEGCANCHKMSYCYESCHKDVELEKAQIDEPNHKLCSKCHLDDNWTFSGTETCAECHKEIYEQSNHSGDKKDCTTCHSPHEWTMNKKGNTCASKCHKEHGDEAAEVAAIPDHESDNCAACHRPHVWDDKSHFGVCTVCHDVNSYDGPGGLHKIGAHQRCGDCHDPHTSQTDPAKDCAACHEEINRLCDAKRPCTDCHEFK